MSTTPIYDDILLEALDFDATLPCQWDDCDPCPHEAEWVIRYRVLGLPEQILACTGHKEQMLTHLAQCRRCPALIQINDVERIR